MNRWVGFILFAILGLAMLWCGLQMPVHLRAVDGVVLRKAGSETPSLVEKGVTLADNNQLGAAQLFLAAARTALITDSPTLSEAVESLATRSPTLKYPGRFADFLPPVSVGGPGLGSNSFAGFVIPSEHRKKALELLHNSPGPLTRELLLLRALTNTVIFPASTSASGQAFDTAVVITGLLNEDGHFSPGFRDAVFAMAAEANRGGSPQPVEETLMDLLSLGQRFNWGQLAMLVENVKEPGTLRALAELMRRDESTPVIYAAVCLTGNAAGVTRYLTAFSKTGLNDLRLSLTYGAGGVNQLLQRQRRICDSAFCDRLAALSSRTLPVGLDFAQREPGLALGVKWFLVLLGGFLIAVALHFGRRVTALERPLEVRGFHLARELLFALGFLLVVLLLSEPFLSQSSQKVEMPFRLQLPMVGGAAPAGNSIAHKSLMNPGILLTLLLFFVLQGLIYIVCLVKLAEIRRQRVPPRIKLKLLENEDHLFDAGLYLGFVGTIVSLILVSLNVIHFSLMAAYSCTCFGIVFVVIFKIFHLRSTRRKLLLEAEAESPEAAAPTKHAYAAPV